MKIATDEQLPGCWIAVDEDGYDGPGSPIGSGMSERAAIEDLLEKLLVVSQDEIVRLGRHAGQEGLRAAAEIVALKQRLEALQEYYEAAEAWRQIEERDPERRKKHQRLMAARFTLAENH